MNLFPIVIHTVHKRVLLVYVYNCDKLGNNLQKPLPVLESLMSKYDFENFEVNSLCIFRIFFSGDNLAFDIFGY